MSGIGWTEFLLIALILLIFVGPQRLPELFGKIAWVVAQLRSASRDLRHQLDEELIDLRQVKSDFTKEMKAQTDRLYEEAHALDEEYRSLRDDVKNVKEGVKNDVGDAVAQLKSGDENTVAPAEAPVATNTPPAERDTEQNRELKG